MFPRYVFFITHRGDAKSAEIDDFPLAVERTTMGNMCLLNKSGLCRGLIYQAHCTYYLHHQ